MQNDNFAIEIDEEADAAYVRISRALVVQTRELADGVLLDLDADNGLAGVEVLGLRNKVGVDDRTSYLHGLVAGLQLKTAAE
jgi:uncharacterized protein YuzE